MRVLICGGRDYNNYEKVKETLDALGDISEIIHGAARGADTLGGRYGREVGIAVTAFPADWDTYGRSAGAIRNRQMLESKQVEMVVAFPGGKGTANMISQAEKAGVKVHVVDVP